jgi:hypothetical protein
MQCPRCGEPLAAGQEYCLECGLRLPGPSRLGPVPPSRRSLALPLVLAALVAAGGATAAIALTRESATATTIVTATGGSEILTTATTASDTLSDWPVGQGSWTNVLVSLPKVEGRDAALAQAEQARRKGLRQVGVLDSSRHASLHPGYWVVFSGVYASEPEAASRLREAKGVQRGAHSAQVTR